MAAKTNSVRERRCEWCWATEDLVECTLGDPPQTILTCADARACQSRWPDEWPSGTLGAPDPTTTQESDDA